MGLFVKQDESRTALQQKIAEDIAARQKAAAQPGQKPVDGVDDSQFVAGTGRMSRVGLIILLAVIAAALTVVIYVTVR